MQPRIRRAALRAAATFASACMAFSLSATAAFAAATPSPRTLTSAQLDQLDQVIQDTARQAGVPGVIVGVWRPGLPRYVRAFGVADQCGCDPMRSDLYMRIGSVTKTFTATALLQLVDRHAVGLDDPISGYVAGVPDGEHITLRELAEMRSGLFPYSADPGFQHLLTTEPHRQFTLQELLAFSFAHPNKFAPGTQFDYSNTNTVLLGMVVEEVTHESLQEAVRDLIAAPTGMDHTFLPYAAEFPFPHARGYTDFTPTEAVADATDFNPSWGWAAGAMISDLEDMHTWAEALGTGRLLTPQTQAQRLQALPTGAPGDFYGLGVDINHGWIGHAGSLPGYQSLVAYLPAQQTAMVILLNTDIKFGGENPSTLLGRAITQVISPGNVYGHASDQT